MYWSKTISLQFGRVEGLQNFLYKKLIEL